MQRDEGEPVSSERSMLWDVLHHLRHVDLIYFVGKFYEFLKEAKLLPIIIPCGLALFTVPLLPVIIAIVIHCVYYGISEGAWLDRHGKINQIHYIYIHAYRFWLECRLLSRRQKINFVIRFSHSSSET